MVEYNPPLQEAYKTGERVEKASPRVHFEQVAANIDVVNDLAEEALGLAEGDTGYGSDFFGSDLDPVAAITVGDQAVFAVDALGRQIQPVGNDFYTGDDEIALAIALDDGRALLAFDDEGHLLADGGSGGSGGPARVSGIGLWPRVAGSQIKAVGAGDEVAADLGSYTALALAPGNDLTVRALIDRPSLGADTSISAGRGWMVPDVTRLLHVYIVLGQSLATGANSEASMILVNPVWPDDALMLEIDGHTDVRLGAETDSGQPADPLDPAKLIGFVPLVSVAALTGPRGQTVAESCATALAQQARDLGIRFRNLSFVAGVGGTAYDGLKKGSQIYANMLIALTRAKALAEAAGWRIVVDACLVKHGEANAGDTAYAAALIEWQADIDADVKAITGQLAPVHFVMSQPSTSYSASFAAPLAMLAVHDSSSVHHLSGADYPFGDAYHTDDLHFTGPGYHWIGETMARACKQVLWQAGAKSKITRITAASRTGNSVVLDYEVPVPPLEFDTTTVPERDAQGFRFRDSAGEITISSAAITGPSQVTLTLATTPSGTGEHVLYALSPQTSPRTAEGRPRGNLRDSSADVSTHLARPLWNWAVHQKFDL